MAPKHLPATAAELFRRWIRKSEVKHAKIAADLQITPGHLSNVSNGIDGPSPELRVRIFELTGIRPPLWDEVSPALPPAPEPAVSVSPLTSPPEAV